MAGKLENRKVGKLAATSVDVMADMMAVNLARYLVLTREQEWVA